MTNYNEMICNIQFVRKRICLHVQMDGAAISASLKVMDMQSTVWTEVMKWITVSKYWLYLFSKTHELASIKMDVCNYFSRIEIICFTILSSFSSFSWWKSYLHYIFDILFFRFVFYCNIIKIFILCYCFSWTNNHNLTLSQQL